MSRVGTTYAASAKLEEEVGARMLERLDYVKLAPACIVDAGSGPAREAPGLLRRYPDASLLAVDFSEPLLRATRPGGLAAKLGRLFSGPRVMPVCANLEALPLATASAQLLWSNMALHWMRDPGAALAEFHRVLAPGGLLMFSTLGPDTLKELRGAFAQADACAHVNTFVDMHDLGDQLGAAGFSAPVMDAETITLTYADADGLFRDLRGSGQANVLEGRPRGLYGRTRWQRMRRSLDACMRDGRLPATAEVVYGHAWREAPRRTTDGHAIVKLERLNRTARKTPGG